MAVTRAGAGPPLRSSHRTGARLARPRSRHIPDGMQLDRAAPERAEPDYAQRRGDHPDGTSPERTRSDRTQPRRTRSGLTRADRGSVTAETAVALPSVFLVALILVWVLAVVTAQLQCVDAARAGARAVSRGESVAASEAAALQAAPDGSTVTISRSGDFVQVEVAAEVEAAGGLLGFLPTVRVDGVAHTIAEDAVAGAAP